MVDIKHLRAGSATVLVTLLVWSCCARGTDSTADRPLKSPTRIEHPNTSDLTLLGISLGRANLASVRKKLGPAKIWSSGDAAAAEHKVCYTTHGPRQIVTVFASNSEMAGPPENTVTEIRVVQGAKYPSLSKCWPTSASTGDVRTQSGLSLGLSEQDVRKILGTPTRVAGAKLDYLRDFEQRVSGPAGKETIIISLWIKIRFRSGSVTSMSIGRMESLP